MEGWRENLEVSGDHDKPRVDILMIRVWAHICSVGSNFVLLDVFELSLEPYTPRRVLVILEEELERTGGNPDFRMVHREGGLWAVAETFWEDLDRKIVEEVA